MQTNSVIFEPHKDINLYKDKLTSYWIFAGLRILLNLIPETGYIHPDEYFQSIEIVAGTYSIGIFNI